MAATAQARDDVQPVANETLDRFLTGTVTVLPILALGLVAWQLWHKVLGWSDIIVFVIMYVATGLGVTVGFHRLFTHRAFETFPAAATPFDPDPEPDPDPDKPREPVPSFDFREGKSIVEAPVDRR